MVTELATIARDLVRDYLRANHPEVFIYETLSSPEADKAEEKYDKQRQSHNF